MKAPQSLKKYCVKGKKRKKSYKILKEEEEFVKS